MQTVDHYPGAEDELSMQDNNTSAFKATVFGQYIAMSGWIC